MSTAPLARVQTYVGAVNTCDLDIEVTAARSWAKGRIAAITAGTSVETRLVVTVNGKAHSWTPRKGWF